MRRRADEFLKQTISRLRSTPLLAIREWPEYPARTAVELGVPVDLLEKRCVFALMTDMLPNGDIRGAVQFARNRLLDMSDMTAQLPCRQRARAIYRSVNVVGLAEARWQMDSSAS